MTEQNELHLFLLEEGIPEVSLPKLILVSKDALIPIVEGYNKEAKTKKFYICVCNSGHDVFCKDWEWSYSGWNIRVIGKKALFFKGDWEFDISQFPIFQNILFIVSKRTKENEIACFRADMFCFSKSRKRLIGRVTHTETNRNRKF